jgi:modulator of FtsH protease HflK
MTPLLPPELRAGAADFRRRYLAGGKIWRLALVPLAVWLLTGLYSVGSNERGVVLRFGRIAGRTGPGLHWTMPWPVDRVYHPKATAVQRIEVGFRFLGRLVDSEADARRSDMLTGDENILKLMMVVQYKVRDPIGYLFGAQQPEFLVERAVESALSSSVSFRRVDDLLTGSKSEVQIEAIEDAQRLLDLYGAGIVLLGGNLQMVSPPAPVIAAFNDVTAAKKDAEKQIEDARLYANQTVPGARGEAAQIVNGARGQADLRVNQARGESDRFLSLLAEYRRDPQLTRRRLYLETMERVLSRAEVMVVSDASKVTILDEPPAR